MGPHFILSVQALCPAVIQYLYQLRLQVLAKHLDALDYVWHAQLKQSQKIPEQYVYTNTVTKY